MVRTTDATIGECNYETSTAEIVSFAYTDTTGHSKPTMETIVVEDAKYK